MANVPARGSHVGRDVAAAGSRFRARPRGGGVTPRAPLAAERRKEPTVRDVGVSWVMRGLHILMAPALADVLDAGAGAGRRPKIDTGIGQIGMSIRMASID